MNHIHRSIWNDALGTWVAVSEIAQGSGKHSSNRRKLFVTSLVFCTASAWALPTGEQVMAGQASVSLSNNHHMEIHQSSQKAVINWQGFSVRRMMRFTFISLILKLRYLIALSGRMPVRFKDNSKQTVKCMWLIPTASFLANPLKWMSADWLRLPTTSTMLISWRVKTTSLKIRNRVRWKITALLKRPKVA